MRSLQFIIRHSSRYSFIADTYLLMQPINKYHTAAIRIFYDNIRQSLSTVLYMCQKGLYKEKSHRKSFQIKVLHLNGICTLRHAPIFNNEQFFNVYLMFGKLSDRNFSPHLSALKLSVAFQKYMLQLPLVLILMCNEILFQ
jgi:hypothetical protein